MRGGLTRSPHQRHFGLQKLEAVRHFGAIAILGEFRDRFEMQLMLESVLGDVSSVLQQLVGSQGVVGPARLAPPGRGVAAITSEWVDAVVPGRRVIWNRALQETFSG